MYELELGSSLSALLSAGGGPAEPLRAFLLGGYAGGWVDAGLADRLRLSNHDLRSFGARLGAGVVVALPASACPVAETVGVAGWLADQSAGQCGPCVNGLAAVADRLADISEGVAGKRALSEVVRWCQLAAGRGACARPDGTASFVTSALRVFAAEFEDHARHGLCDACEHPGILLTAPHAGVAACCGSPSIQSPVEGTGSAPSCCRSRSRWMTGVIR